MDEQRISPAGDPFYFRARQRTKHVFGSYYPGDPERALDAEQRFWGYVDKSSGQAECWLWTGGRFGSGYGSFTVGAEAAGTKKRRRAHRVAYELVYGVVPDGLNVLHRCDNPPCCNPAHLWLGTHADNHADRDAKGRHRTRSGEDHPMARLTNAEVRALRERYARGDISQEALAQESGVPRRTLWGILSGKSRKGAGGPTYAVARRNETDLLTAIREEQARIGRHMTDSELDRFAREFYAPEYRAELRRLVALGVTDEEGEEE